jgi:hypothetical protein
LSKNQQNNLVSRELDETSVKKDERDKALRAKSNDVSSNPKPETKSGTVNDVVLRWTTLFINVVNKLNNSKNDNTEIRSAQKQLFGLIIELNQLNKQNFNDIYSGLNKLIVDKNLKESDFLQNIDENLTIAKNIRTYRIFISVLTSYANVTNRKNIKEKLSIKSMSNNTLFSQSCLNNFKQFYKL